LFYEAFGTRHGNVANTFLNHLSRLCSTQFDQEQGAWVPNADELLTAIAMVQSQKPRNEAEAALAAQAVALHFAAMKVGRHIAAMTYPDSRTIASLARVGKAFSGNLETMQKLKGRKTARQRITVHHERHIHHHQHVHVEGGASNSGGQAHAPMGARSDEHEPLAALRGTHQTGKVVLLPCREGEDALPVARRR
jgi:hypothetical protein